MDSVRPYIQFLTLIIVSVAAYIFYKYRGDTRFCGTNACGVFVLCLHIIIYYTFVLLWSAGIFYLPEFINDLFGFEFFGFGVWSAAIRLQTAIEILLMALTIKRRQTWMNTLTS